MQSLNTNTAAKQVSLREFFKTMVTNHIDKTLMNARVDFLAAHPANSQDGPIIASAIQNLLEVKLFKERCVKFFDQFVFKRCQYRCAWT